MQVITQLFVLQIVLTILEHVLVLEKMTAMLAQRACICYKQTLLDIAKQKRRTRLNSMSYETVEWIWVATQQASQRLKLAISTRCQVNTRLATSFRKLSLVFRSTTTSWSSDLESASWAPGTRLIRSSPTQTGRVSLGPTKVVTTHRPSAARLTSTAWRSTRSWSHTELPIWVSSSPARAHKQTQLLPSGASRTWPSVFALATLSVIHASGPMLRTA